MRYLPSAVVVMLLSGACAEAQTVTYVTRSRAATHAVSFGSTPLRTTSTTTRTAAAKTQRHAVEFGSRALRAELPKEYVAVNNGAHTTARAEQVVVRTTSRTVGPRSERTTDRRRDRKRSASKAEAGKTPSRHMLRVLALMDNKLDCHQ